MANLKYHNFKGRIPRVDTRSLPDGYAEVATNVQLFSGTLKSWRDTVRVGTLSKAGPIQSLYRWGATPNADGVFQIVSVLDLTPVQLDIGTHGLTTGDKLFISETGLSIDNTLFTITVINPTMVSLDGSSAAGTATTGYAAVDNGYWFHSASIVDYVKGAIAGDTAEHTYFTGEGAYPKFTRAPEATSGGGTDYPINSFQLGLPAPVTSPSVIAGAASSGSVANIFLNNNDNVRVQSTAHGIQSGYRITFAGVGGTTELNGNTYQITKQDDNYFTLDNTDSALFTAYTSGGTWAQSTDLTDQIHRTYIYAFVTPGGDLGPTSGPSPDIGVVPSQAVTVGAMDSDPGGAYDLGALATKRIYRTAVGSKDYFLVAEIPIAQTSYVDTLDDSQLGEIATSIGWSPPPADLHSIRMMPNGIMVGLSKNKVLFSIPWKHHAWPDAFSLSTVRDGVALETIGNSVVVCTEDYPYVISGTDPRSMSMEKVSELQQTCVSKRSIVTMDQVGVVFASPDGLVAIGPKVREVITNAYITKDQWQQLNPSSILGFVVERRYFGFYTKQDGTKAGFVFDPRSKEAGWVDLTVWADAGFYDILSDAVYLVQGSAVLRWDSAATWLQYVYRTREMRTLDAVSMAVSQAYITDPKQSLVIDYYADGTLRHSRRTADSKEHTLPGGFLAEVHQFEFTGDSEIKEYIVAESADELRLR